MCRRVEVQAVSPDRGDQVLRRWRTLYPGHQHACRDTGACSHCRPCRPALLRPLLGQDLANKRSRRRKEASAASAARTWLSPPLCPRCRRMTGVLSDPKRARPIDLHVSSYFLSAPECRELAGSQLGVSPFTIRGGRNVILNKSGGIVSIRKPKMPICHRFPSACSRPQPARDCGGRGAARPCSRAS